MQPRGPAQVHERFVQRQRLDRRGQVGHHRAHRFRDRRIDRHARPDHHRLGAQLQRLKHRHCRPHPLDPGDIAGGQHHPALAAADDHRLFGQLRIVTLFDRGIKGVAIHMRHRKRHQLGVVQHPRPTAGRAPGGRIERGQTIATERRHGPSIPVERQEGYEAPRAKTIQWQICKDCDLGGHQGERVETLRHPAQDSEGKLIPWT